MDTFKKKTKITPGVEVKTWQQELLAAIDGFAAVQEEQLQKLAAGKLKDMMSWRHRRQNVFDRLKQYLDLIEPYSKNDTATIFMRMVQERMKKILEIENALNNAAKAQREKLAGQLSALRKGKKALQRYRLCDPASRPKYLSNRA